MWNYDYRYPFAPQQNLYGFQCSARSYNFVPTTESVSQRGTVDSESVTTGTGTKPVESAGTTAKCTYAFKIINPRKKGEYVTKTFRADGAFKTPEELQDKMYETFSDFLPEGRDFELGFYQGRGGSKTAILDEEDMTSMYEYYSSLSQEISRWCHGEFRSEHQPEPSLTYISCTSLILPSSMPSSTESSSENLNSSTGGAAGTTKSLKYFHVFNLGSKTFSTGVADNVHKNTFGLCAHRIGHLSVHVSMKFGGMRHRDKL